MAADPYYAKCAVTGKRKERCRIEWHHNLIYAGRQVNERFAIIPLAQEIHDQAREKKVRDLLDWIMLSRATPEELARYSKVIDYRMKLERLKGYYGHYDENQTYHHHLRSH